MKFTVYMNKFFGIYKYISIFLIITCVYHGLLSIPTLRVHIFDIHYVLRRFYAIQCVYH